MKLFVILLATSLLLIAPQAHSRDSKHMFTIGQAIQSDDFKQKLDPGIRLFFGNQKHPKVTEKLGKFSSNKKTSSFNKTDKEACQWVLLSALLSLQDRAKNEGGNAVINIASYYKKNTISSDTEYECHAGAVIAGVAMIGDVVTLAR